MDLECQCGCGELRFSQYKNENSVSISYHIPTWYANEFSGWKKAWKIIWNVLRGKQYYLYEILIDDNKKLKEFKEFVANMPEIKEDVT